MKQKVIEFFQNLPDSKPEQFNKAFELYRQSEHKNQSTERVLNASGYSPGALENLLYDLQKMHGITDVEKATKIAVVKEVPEVVFDFRAIESMPEEEFISWCLEMRDNPDDLQKIVDLATEKGEDAILELLNPVLERVLSDKAVEEAFLEFKHLLDLPAEEIAQWADLRQKEQGDLDKIAELAFLNDAGELAILLRGILNLINTHIEESSKNIDTVDEVESLKADNEELSSENENLLDENQGLKDENDLLSAKVDAYEKLPTIDAGAIREEFPFLKEKDCPDELKILVADKITAWNDYVMLHSNLHKIEEGSLVVAEEEKAEMAKKAVEAFEENQAIYDELNAYKETGAVLGKHRIFKRLAVQREVDVMDNDALVKYKGSSAKFFSTNKKLMAKAVEEKDQERIQELQAKIDDRNERLDYVNKKLGISGK